MPENIPVLRVVQPERHIRFGPFELDSRAGELRKHGIKIRIGQQAFEVLLMILKQPGEVVLREEIRQKLWPRDTVVEFEHSINAVIQKLRDALGESADNPRYIETLPRRGYRFIGTVEMPPAELVIPEPAAVQSPPRNWTPLIFAMAIVLLGALALAAWLRPWQARAPARNLMFSLGSYQGMPVMSPDGSAVVYCSRFRGTKLRRLDSLRDIPLPSLNPVNFAEWSPDGSQLLGPSSAGFVRVPITNGPTVTINAKTGPVCGGFSWGSSGYVLAATCGGSGNELDLVPEKGGDPARPDLPGLTNGGFLDPEFLPDGRNFLFAWIPKGAAEADIYLATQENGKITRAPILLRKNRTSTHYAPSGGGRLLYVQDDNLYAQKLNVRRGTLEGEPERIVEGVYSYGATAGFSVSRNGVLVWLSGREDLVQLTWFDRKGNVTGTAGPRSYADIVRLSPDEKHMILGNTIVEDKRTGRIALPGVSDWPLWMPDGSHILFSRREGSSDLVLERGLEGEAEKTLARLPKVGALRDVSADGKVLLYSADNKLYSARLDGSPEAAKPEVVSAETNRGTFSPDGRWVVYSAKTVGNKTDIFVQPFPMRRLRKQLTSTGGEAPVWRGDGKEILYRNVQTVYSLRVESRGSTIQASEPVALFATLSFPSGIQTGAHSMDVTRDGSRILFEQGDPLPLPYVMTAWDTLLKR